MNLPGIIRQYLPESSITAISQRLGEPPQRVASAISACIPAVLSFYSDAVGTPINSDRAYEKVRGLGPAALDRLPEILQTSETYSLCDDGQHHFSSLFGQHHLENLAHAVSQFSGLGMSSSKAVVGMVNAICLAAISKHSTAQSGHELASFISESRPSIAAAIPAGLHEYLDDMPDLRDVVHPYDEGFSTTANDDAMADEAEMPRQENYHNERYYKADHATRVPGNMAWVIPMLILVAIAAALIFTIYPVSRQAPAPTAAPTVRPEATGLPQAYPDISGAQPAGGRLEGGLPSIELPADPMLPRDLSMALQRVNAIMQSGTADAQWQQKLNDARRDVGALQSRSMRLPPDQKRQLAAEVRREISAMQRSAEKSPDARIRREIKAILDELQSISEAS